MRTNTRKFGLALAALALVALLIAVFGAVSVWATDYYVRTDGDDSNTGLANDAANAWLTIQHAVDNVSSGDTINVAAGMYDITAPIDVNKSVTITGEPLDPENVVVQYNPASTTLAIFDMNAADITVQGITAKDGKNGFLWGQTDTAYTGCTVTDCIVENASSFAIGEIPATGTIISNNTIDTCGDKGIYIRACHATSAGERAEVTGNTISGCTSPAIQVYDSPYTYVYDNTISSTGDKGINIHGPNAASQAEKVIVEGNTISGCPYPAIQVSGDRYTYIYNNTIGPTNDKGINVIQSNTTGTADRIQVISNTISLCKWPGIQSFGAPYTYIYNNTLSQCNYDGGDVTPDFDYGSITVANDGAFDGSHVIVDNNDVSDGGNGIVIWSDNCTVTNNDIYNMGLTYLDSKPQAGNDGPWYNSAIVIGGLYETDPNDPSGTAITGNSIDDNYWGLQHDSRRTNNVTAECNWWGDASGPYHPTTNPNGSGDEVSDHVDYGPPWLLAPAPGGACGIWIQIDIKPGSDPNSINPGNKGTIPVAILSTEWFKAPEEVDPSSLAFGPGEAPLHEIGGKNKKPHCSAEDVNDDGLLDLVCHFKTQETGFESGDTEGILKGQTLDGIPMAIEGRDSVQIVPSNKGPAVTEQVQVVASPNPVRNVDTATFQVMGTLAAEVEEIRVQIYDLSGRLVWEDAALGSELDWHTDSLSGDYLANGIYLYRVQVRIGGSWINQDIGKIAVLR
jgi:parallel beta-helix repeat protein